MHPVGVVEVDTPTHPHHFPKKLKNISITDQQSEILAVTSQQPLTII